LEAHVNPDVVRNQLACSFAVALVAGVPGQHGLRVFIGCAVLALLIEWFVLKTWYWLETRSADRMESRFDGDRLIGICTTVGAAIALLVLALSQRLLHDPNQWGWRHWAVADSVPACAVVLVIALPISSVIDWYWVRPRRDGIVWRPVCQDEPRKRRKRLTRVVLWHRAVTTLTWGLGVAFLTFCFFYAVKHFVSTHTIWHPFVDQIDAPLSLALLALTGWSQGLVGALPALAGRATVVLGDLVRVQESGGDYDGVVYEVSLEGPTIVDGAGVPRRPTKRLDDPRVTKIDESDPHSFVRCPLASSSGGGKTICGGLDDNNDCQWGTERLEPSQDKSTKKIRPRPPIRFISVG
jgi:hypothetical protein